MFLSLVQYLAMELALNIYAMPFLPILAIVVNLNYK